MDAEAIEKEAHAAALVQVAQMFQRPDQLEKLDTLKKRADRKKVITFLGFYCYCIAVSSAFGFGGQTLHRPGGSHTFTGMVEVTSSVV